MSTRRISGFSFKLSVNAGDGSTDGRMIRIIIKPNGRLAFDASVSGPLVYLDNWAIYDLAERDVSRRQWFVKAIHSGIDLLFSVTNAAELYGPQGHSADAVRAFLDEIGPRWFPAKLNSLAAVEGEKAGNDLGAIVADENFFQSFVLGRMESYTAGSGKVIDPSGDFFCLGSLLERMGRQRDSIRAGSARFDEMLTDKIAMVRDRAKRDPAGLDRVFPWRPFNPDQRASFVFSNFLRVLATEGGSVKRNDGLDFCHAVMACAFASFAALDTHWKRRAESLPKPNLIARIYS